MKANAVSSTYLMGQGKEDWDKEKLIITEPFERAAWVSQNLKKFFKSDGPEEAEALKQYRLTALTAVLDLANFTSFVASNFYRPIGQNRDCGFYPEGLIHSAVWHAVDEGSHFFKVVMALETTLDVLASRLDEMRGNVTDGTYLVEEEGVDALSSLCKTYDMERNLGILRAFVRPGCEEARLSWQKDFLASAKQNGMEGGTENGCLQVFIARYTQSWNATSMFKDSLDKYVYLSITIQGFCYPLVGDDSPTKEQYLNSAKEIVNAIRTGMSEKLDSLKLNESVPWTCKEQQTTTTALTPRSTESEPQTAVIHPFSTSMTAPVITPEEVKKFVTDELDHAGEEFVANAWVSRIGSYREMINRAVSNIRNTHNDTLSGSGGGSVEGIMYLPYGKDDDEQQCLQVFNMSNGGQAEEHRYKGADFFIRFTYNIDAAVLPSTMEKIAESKDALLGAIFSPKGGNLCKRVTDATQSFENSANVTIAGKGRFSAIAAVKCGRQFVWYELGYRYFAAAGASNSSYVITSGNVDTYNANCGQVMFFP